MAAGTLATLWACETGKLPDAHTQNTNARRATSGELPRSKTIDQIKQRRGAKGTKPRAGLHQVFVSESGLKVTVTAKSKANYHEVERALSDAPEEVRHRIRNNRKLH